MAEFDTFGFDDVEKQLLRQSKIASEAVPKMLEAGADVIVKAHQEGILREDLIRTGDFYRSIGIVGGAKITNIDAYITVEPKGKDRKGVRNAEKGAIAEYGLRKGKVSAKRRKKSKDGKQIFNNRNQAARPWMSESNERCKEKVHQVMREVWEEMNNDG